MQITQEIIDHLARLSRIQLTDNEREMYRQQLGGLFTMFEQLQEIDTDGVTPTYQVTGLTNAFRPDEVCDSGMENALLANAPRGSKNGEFITPDAMS